MAAKTSEELLVMGRIDRQLSELDDAARRRVIVWVAQKYGADLEPKEEA